MNDPSIKNDTEPTLATGQIKAVAGQSVVAPKSQVPIQVDTAHVSDVGQLAALFTTTIQSHALNNQSFSPERLEALRLAYRTGSLSIDLNKLSEIMFADEGR